MPATARTFALAAPVLLALLAGPALSAPVAPDRADGVWLTGDTHVHTDHSSDGSGPRQALDQRGPGSTPVSAQLAAAQRRGLDFLPITDHRTYDQHWDPQWTSSSMLLVPGEEANSSPHANVLGAVDQTTDGAEPPGSPGYRHLQQSIWDVHAQDAVWQTTHPDDGEIGSDGRPNANASATGVDLVEVLNSESPEAKLDYAENRWNAGWRFGVVAASDSHFTELDAVQGPGLPSTRVLAAARTERALLDGFLAGHTALSRGPGAPVVELAADTDGDGRLDALAGDERLVPAGSTVRLSLRVRGGAGNDVIVYGSPGRSAGPVATFRPVLPDETFAVGVPVRPGDSWYRVEVRGPGGVSGVRDPATYDPVRQLQAATSPLFLSTSRLAEPRAELPLPPTSGSDRAGLALGPTGRFTGFADVAVTGQGGDSRSQGDADGSSGGRAHVVAERHDAGRTSVVYRRGSETTRETDLAPASSSARLPRVAARGDRVAVVWQDERTGQAPRRPDVYLRTSDDGGRTWAPEQRLTAGAGRAERPVVGLLLDGTPVVAWQDNRRGAFEVLVQRIGVDPEPVDLSRAGKTIDPGNPLDARSARYPASLFPALAVSPDGAVSVGWQDDRTDPDPLFTGSMQTPRGTAPDDWEVLVTTLAPAGSTWSAPVPVSSDPRAADRHPCLLYDDRGVLHVAWDAKALQAAGVNVAVRTSSSSDGGRTFAPPVTVGLDPDAMSQRPRLGLEDGGGVRLVWQDSRSVDWRWKVFTATLADPTAGGWSSAQQVTGAGNGTWPAVSRGQVVFTTDRHAVRVQRDRTQQVMLLRL